MASVRVGRGDPAERGMVPYHPASQKVQLCKPSLRALAGVVLSGR